MNEKTINTSTIQNAQNLQGDGADHEVYGLLMSLALDDLLSSQEEADLHGHLAGCAPCAGQWAAWSGLHERLVAEPALDPAPGFGTRFELRRLQQVRRRRLWMGGLVAMMSLALWGTILGVGLVAGSYFLNNPTGTLPQIIYDLTYTWAGLSAGLQALWRGLTVAMTTSNLPMYLAGYSVAALFIVALWTNYLRRSLQPSPVANAVRQA